jgi:hypothetical protein
MEIHIKKIERASNFIHLVAELDGEIYQGVLLKGGKEEKRTQDMVSS